MQENTFTDYVVTLFHVYGFGAQIEMGDRPGKVDLLFHRQGVSIPCEVKAYRSRQVAPPVLNAAVESLWSRVNSDRLRVLYATRALLVVTCYVPESVVRDIERVWNIVIVDRSRLYHMCKTAPTDGAKLTSKLEAYLNEWAQGTESKGVFDDVNPFAPFDVVQAIIQPERPPVVRDGKPEPHREKGEALIEKLASIPLGQTGWRAYESWCLACLQYLFEGELSNWREQIRNDDGLSRYDLICRITPTEEFWQSLITFFHSRYVVFEFKNYRDPLHQESIYLTERYLNRNALRGVGVILARTGFTEGARRACAGSLREQGKLLILLDATSLREMLRLRDEGESISDYLTHLLDDFLMALPR